MSIKRFSFIDKFHCWTLEEMSFSQLNLLVGKSGVGKTNILKALKSIRKAGISSADWANGCEWMIEIESENMKLLWEAKVSLVAETSLGQFINDNGDEDEYEDEYENEKQSIEKPYFLKERIIRDEKDEIVNRTGDNFIFKGEQLPKLKNTESAISLLIEEEDIAPLNKALRRMIFGQSGFVVYQFDASNFKKIRQRYPNLDALREARNIPSLIKAYILQEDYPKEFEYIKTDYLDIFDTVKDIKLGRLSELDPCTSQEDFSTEDWLVVGLEEEGVKGWITSPRISSGMHRTFSYLIDLVLAPPGTVIIIDEVENSLGVNCLPDIIDRFLRRPRELQFILTSHHPYIIENIPSDQWQIVTRKGSIVRVVAAKTISAFKTNSAHDKFIQLINLKEFEEGIQ